MVLVSERLVTLCLFDVFKTGSSPFKTCHVRFCALQLIVEGVKHNKLSNGDSREYVINSKCDASARLVQGQQFIASYSPPVFLLGVEINLLRVLVDLPL